MTKNEIACSTHAHLHLTVGNVRRMIEMCKEANADDRDELEIECVVAAYHMDVDESWALAIVRNFEGDVILKYDLI